MSGLCLPPLRSFSGLGVGRIVRLFANNFDVFTGTASLCDLPGFFFGEDVTHGHAVDSLQPLSLAFSLPEAAGEEEAGQDDVKRVFHPWFVAARCSPWACVTALPLTAPDDDGLRHVRDHRGVDMGDVVLSHVGVRDVAVG